MKISVLGTGCPKCKKLAETAEEAAQQLGIVYELEKVTDINAIMGYGVMITPALVIDGKVVTTGKVLSVEETKKLLSGNGGQKPGGGCGCGGGGG